MSNRTVRIVEALGGAAWVLLIVRWLDTDVVASIQRQAGANFDLMPAAVASSLGDIVIAASALLIVALARRAVNLWVGVPYAVGGAFLAFLFPVTWLLTAKGANPPILTGPIANLLERIWSKAEQGPLNSVAILGAVLFLVGLVTIGSAVRNRRKPVAQGEVSPLQPQASL